MSELGANLVVILIIFSFIVTLGLGVHLLGIGLTEDGFWAHIYLIEGLTIIFMFMGASFYCISRS